MSDPETQPLMMRMKSDIVPYLVGVANGTLHELSPIEWDPRSAVCVVMASGGYPGKYNKGHQILGLETSAGREDTKVFHAGTVKKDGKILTAGGRVLNVTALADGHANAVAAAYSRVFEIAWADAYFRKDIGKRPGVME